MRMSRESCYQNSKNKKFTCNIHVKSYFTCEFLNFWVFITFCIHMGNVMLKMCRHVNSLVVLGPQIHLNINFCFYLKKYIYLGKKIYKVGHIYPNISTSTYFFFLRLIVNWVGFLFDYFFFVKLLALVSINNII